MVLRLSLSDSLLCLYCFPILSSGVETQKIDFQSDLSNKLDKSYWSKSDVARMAAAAKSSQSSLSLDVVRAQESGPPVLQTPGPDLPRLSSQSVLVPKPTARLVPSTKVKNAVLDSYQKKFGHTVSNPITTTSKGTSSHLLLQPPSQSQLVTQCKMKPNKDKHYGLSSIGFINIVPVIFAGFLTVREKKFALSRLCKILARAVPEMHRLFKIDWRPITKPRLNYQNQSSIDPHRVDMATALALRSGLDPGKLLELSMASTRVPGGTSKESLTPLHHTYQMMTTLK